jgi:hypothetical protein
VVRIKTLIAAALWVGTGVAGASVVDEADWTLRDQSKLPVNWTQNGDARLGLNLNGFGIADDPLVTLRLTENRPGQVSAVWQQLRGRVPSFSFIADVRVSFDPAELGPCPGEGFILAFADAPTDALGAPGGNLGIFNTPIPRITAMEVNTSRLQGLGTDAERSSEDGCKSGKNETFAFDVMRTNDADRGGSPADPAKGGVKIGQVNPPAGLKLVNSGVYRYQFNADGVTNTLTAYITGMDDENKQFQKVKVLEQKIGVPILNFSGRFGLTAGTGATGMQVDLLYTRIEVPMAGSG